VLSAGALPIVETITLSALAGQSGRYGPIRLWGSIGFIATVLAGGAWLDAWPASTLAWVCAALALAALASSLWLPGGARTIAEAPADAGAGRTDAPAARALLGAGFCMATAHGALYAFFTLHLERIGYSGTAIGALWTLGVLAEIVVFLYLPALFRRFALSAILVASFACAALRFAAIGWGADLLAVLVLAQLLHAATFGAFHAASVAAIARVFAPGAQARGQTLFSSACYGAGGAFGALLAGWAWEAGGAALAFALASVAGAAGGALAWRLRNAGI
jgi:PPP family 3-phenylpropionic acid transporter